MENPKRGSIIPKQNDPAGYSITVQDLNTILEANQKALTIYLEVEKQNEDILEALKEDREKLEKIDDLQIKLIRIQDQIQNQLNDGSKNNELMLNAMSDQSELIEELKVKITDMDKLIFRLIIVLGSAGVGTIITLVQAFLIK